MKKIISYIILFMMMFSSFKISTNALTEEELKNQIEIYENRISSLQNNLSVNLNDFRVWSNKYRDELKQICTMSILKDVFSLIEMDNYEAALDLLSQKLLENNYLEATNTLNEMKPNLLASINEFTNLENELYSFLNDNSNNILISDLIPLSFTLNEVYNSLKFPFKQITQIYYGFYSDLVKKHLKEYDIISLEQVNVWFDKYEEEIITFESFINFVTNKINKWQDITSKLDLEELDFADSLKADIETYYQKFDNLFIGNYDFYQDKAFTNLKEEFRKITNDNSISANDKNNLISNKINDYNSFLTNISNHFNNLKQNMKSNYMLDKIQNLETHVDESINEMINYLNSLYVIEDYDIELKDQNMSNTIIIDRPKKSIVIKNEYNVDNFTPLFIVRNNGLLRFENTYNNRIGTKSILGVYKSNKSIQPELTYNIVLKGDVRSNGIIDISDVTYIIKSVLSKKTFDDIEMLAADMNMDNKIDISDVTATIKKALS